MKIECPNDDEEVTACPCCEKEFKVGSKIYCVSSLDVEGRTCIVHYCSKRCIAEDMIQDVAKAVESI